MPLYETKHIDSQSILAVWRVEEGVEELKRQVYLSEQDEEHFATLANERRRKEWLATRLLTQMMLEEEVSIFYEESGKPYLLNGWEISITHKNEFVGIILGKNRIVAVDIEQLASRLDKVYDFFMSDRELKSLHPYHRNFQMHLVWCAKECLIKVTNQRNLKPTEDMYVPPINHQETEFIAEVCQNGKMVPYTFHFDKLSNDYVVVWTSDKEIE